MHLMTDRIQRKHPFSQYMNKSKGMKVCNHWSINLPVHEPIFKDWSAIHNHDLSTRQMNLPSSWINSITSYLIFIHSTASRDFNSAIKHLWLNQLHAFPAQVSSRLFVELNGQLNKLKTYIGFQLDIISSLS